MSSPNSAAQVTSSTTPASSSSAPVTRSSARRAQQTQETTSSSASAPSTRLITTTGRTRSSSTKGKQKEPQVPNPPAVPLSINDSLRDTKGKKRAAPEPDTSSPSPSDNDVDSSRPPPAKKAHITRNTTKAATPKSQKKGMSRKNKSSTPSIAVKSRAAKSRAIGGPSATVRDNDVDMLDGDHHSEPENLDDSMDIQEKPHVEDEENESDDDIADGNRDPRNNDPINAGSSGTADSAPPPPSSAAAPNPPSAFGEDHPSAMAMFSSDFRSLGAHMLAQSTKLKGYLAAIKPSSDPTVRFAALQELNELLVMSNEDTLSGYFQVDAFVKELIGILGGKPLAGDEDDDDAGDDEGEEEEDAALAAALAMSTGSVLPGDENPEAQVLASRCLYNLMEALPGSAHTIVYHGAVPALCSKLLEIQFIDLAEQNISTLDKISEECASSLARQGGLPALLNFLDFFNTSVQRTALHAAANCCRNASPDVFKTIRESFPIIRNVLSYPDQRLVESASLCVIRTIESYHRTQPDLLDELLVQDDMGLVRAIIALLLPAGGSPVISTSTYTLFLRALSTAAKASPKTTIALLEADIASTVYQILTGVMPSTSVEGAEGTSEGVTGTLADMAVMQNLAHRPKEQVEEALSLISELMPPLPKDGVFDHRAYSEKSLSRLIKSKAKADRAAARQSKLSPSGPPTPVAQDESPDGPDSKDGLDTVSNDSVMRASSPIFQHPIESTRPPSAISAAATASVTRLELLRGKPDLIARFMGMIVPILVEVYAASVALNIRTRTLTGLLKACSFLEPAALLKVVENVPLASFTGSILSTRDQQTLVAGALQLVELLLTKLPTEYYSAFRREGVLHEIETIGTQELTPKVKTEPPSSATNTPAPDDLHTTSSIIMAASAVRRPSSHVDPQDANILRARVIRFKHLSDGVMEAASNVAVGSTFETLRIVVARLSDLNASEAEARESLKMIGDLFSTRDTSLSSFELIKSGLVGGLLSFATADDRYIDVNRRQALILETLARSGDLPISQSPFATLVKRLQESLTRMESFEVVTVSPGGDDSRRNSASLLARQLRLRLVGEGSDIPKSCTNITVSIHAIATFQALHDYLRPRVSSQGLPPGSRISGMLAAFAAAAGIPSSALTRPPNSTAGQSVAGSSSTNDDASTATATTSTAAATSSGTVTAANGEEATKHGKVENGPRRSRRLSAKDVSMSGATAPTTPAPSPSVPKAPAPPSQGSSEPRTESIEMDDPEEGFIDAEMFDDEERHSPTNEKTVNLAVADDGDKVVAQTPDGTRIATPNPMRDGPAADSMASAKASYASAAKTKPNDWHLEFSIEGHTLPLETTVYGAIHQHEARRSAKPSLYLSTIWSGVYTIKFKKASGPARLPDNPADVIDRAGSPPASAVPDDSPHSKILRLLRVLHKIHVDAHERASMGTSQAEVLPESAFVNNKLTAKLTRQLEEPMIVASACLPDWAVDLPQNFPFLFPFATRFSFLQSTSFGYARLILKWQNQQSRAGDSNSRRDDTFGYLGRLQRQKVRISRKHLLESAIKVLELYGSSSSVLEVEYFEEVGTGLGPTLEFYSLVSKEFARRNIKMWHDADVNSPGPYVHHPTGLYPAPFGAAEILKEEKTTGKKRSDIFRVLGQFVAKALLDSRIIDMSFNRTFLKLLLGREMPRTIQSLATIDASLAKSLRRVEEYVDAQCFIEADPYLSAEEREKALSSVQINGATLSDLSLDFTAPGYDIELQGSNSSSASRTSGGKDMSVDHSNVREYIDQVLDTFLGSGVKLPVKAFREGFSKVFPISDLQTFSSDEILTIFGNPHEDWSHETLSDVLKADHGFNADSRSFKELVQVMSSYDAATRREFLQFMTGSPKLPIGGFRGLTPPLTVVRKPHEPPLSPDDYLPSVMTCVNYLKLPAYSSKEVLAAKLRVAMKEGGGSFHLS